MADKRSFRTTLKNVLFSRKLVISIALCGGLMLGGVIGVLWIGTQGLPSLESLQDYQPSLITRVYSDEGDVIGQFFVERRIYIPFEEIPQSLINAIIAVEDSRFFEHPGLDVVGIFRAAWTNLKSGGKVQGASTITQQLARTLFLSRERTYKRKIRELILAFKMELVLSKEKILEMYLNQIYFGHGAYGVGSASQTYFSKDLSEITLSESAILAGLPKAPNTYSPYRNPELAKNRQEHVLGRMVQTNFISKTEAEEAISAELAFHRKSLKPIASYFLEHIRQTLVAHYGETMVYKGGLQVHTTLNVAMQKAADEAVHRGLHELDKRQGWRGPLGQQSLTDLAENPVKSPDEPNPHGILKAIVTKTSGKSAEILVENIYKGQIALADMAWAHRRLKRGKEVTEAVLRTNLTAKEILKPGDIIEVTTKHGDLEAGEFVLDQTPLVQGSLLALDPRTGAVLAMVGGYDFGRSEFNRAITARRQPGSAFKPIIYAAALNKGYTPATLILDAPVVYEQEDDGEIWKPENYEKRFFGMISLREALRHSRNAATVRLLEQIGVQDVMDLSMSLGITSPLSQDLSLALGSSSVTLQEITSSYGVFANQGLWLPPYTITMVKNLEGEVLEQHIFEPQQAVSKETAYLVTNMMMDVIQSGTGRRAKSIGRPLAGKTGTTNSYRDAWFVGYAPNLATGVWVGFDGVRTLGRLESGAHAALPIWTDYMAKALEPLPVTTFSIPDGIRFAQVDTETGTLPSQLSKSITTEVFAEGTEPSKPVIPKPTPLDFFEMDQIGPSSATASPSFE
ncbi:MAG: penicillin-binding protein [Nitrospirales bacterium]|nr:MAG: penicillin-binding protein [Nitrospirales bacterium]